MFNFTRVTHLSFVPPASLFPVCFPQDHAVCGMEVDLPWTSVIDLLPMAQFVGAMLNGADVLPVFSFSPSFRTQNISPFVINHQSGGT